MVWKEEEWALACYIRAKHDLHAMIHPRGWADILKCRLLCTRQHEELSFCNLNPTPKPVCAMWRISTRIAGRSESLRDAGHLLRLALATEFPAVHLPLSGLNWAGRSEASFHKGTFPESDPRENGVSLFTTHIAVSFAALPVVTSGSGGVSSHATPSQQQWRSFAKRLAIRPPTQGIVQPAGLPARPIRVFLTSPGIIAEPYRGRPPKIPFTDYLGAKGWKERWKRIRGGMKSMYSLARIRNALGPSITIKGFKQDSLKLYEDVCAHIAAGEKGELRDLVSPAMFSQLKKEIDARKAGGWTRIEWSMTKKPTIREVEVLQARLIGNIKQDDMLFAQLTLKFPSRQKFVAYNKGGKLVSGDPEKEYDVQDYWVLEKLLRKDSLLVGWKLAGRLEVT